MYRKLTHRLATCKELQVLGGGHCGQFNGMAVAVVLAELLHYVAQLGGAGGELLDPRGGATCVLLLDAGGGSIFNLNAW